MLLRISLSLYLCLFLFSSSHSQTTPTIKFAKGDKVFYFFQKGIKSDTISDKKNNLFYLIIPDSLKESISIQVHNGQLLATINDSIVQLNFIQGLKYESVCEPGESNFATDNKQGRTNGNKKKSCYLTTRIDGTSTISGNKITIIIYNRRYNAKILENEFYWR